MRSNPYTVCCSHPVSVPYDTIGLASDDPHCSPGLLIATILANNSNFHPRVRRARHLSCSARMAFCFSPVPYQDITPRHYASTGRTLYEDPSIERFVRRFNRPNAPFVCQTHYPVDPTVCQDTSFRPICLRLCPNRKPYWQEHRTLQTNAQHLLIRLAPNVFP